MPLTKFGIERPAAIDAIDDEDARVWLRVVETLAKTGSAQEVKSSYDPRTWSVQAIIAALVAIVTTLGWIFNSGGKLEKFDSRIQAMETRQAQYETIYARRDLLEQQMGYVVSGLNELKVKVDALTAAQRSQ